MSCLPEVIGDWKRMGRNARETIEEDWAWEVLVEKWEKTLKI